MIGVQSVLWEPGVEGPSEKGFKSPSNERIWHKPAHGTGMWTSTYLGPEQISDWARWCRSESFGCGVKRLWLLTPRPDANLIVINTQDDLHRFLARPEQRAYVERQDPRFRTNSFAVIDFEALAVMGVDGIHLTESGQWATHLSFPGLYGWDSESTCWLRWAFDDVMDGGIVTVEAVDYDDPGTDVEPEHIDGTLRHD